MQILTAVSNVAGHVEESSVLDFSDPQMFKFPVIYLVEPGYWVPDDEQVVALRNYLDKGGFLIVDDFLLNQWVNFERSMRLVIPDARIVRLDVTHPIFDSFFHISTLAGMSHPGTPNARAEYYGIYENNDPTRRLVAIINYNNDIGDYMEWSGEGWYPVNMSNDAYKLATNYIVYGLTH